MLTNNIIRLLNQKHIEYILHNLNTDEKVSAVEVAILLDQPNAKIFKTIIFRPETKKEKWVAALVPANRQVDEKRLAAALNLKKLAAAKQSDAEQKTGMLSGGISPLGLINKAFLIVADDSINSLETVIISAGVRGWQIEMNVSDLLTLCKANVIPISTHYTTST
jgi:Cys-tRNA(Pro)/Cys-tRNA(Cys) deacylase